MADIVKHILARPIQLADQVTKLANDVHHSFKQDCCEIKAKTEKLAGLLRQAARASSDLYEKPTRRIIKDTEQVLNRALTIVVKCRRNGLMKRVFTIIPAAALRKTSLQLENSIGDVSWLLRVSAFASDRRDDYLGLPPIASNEPILSLIWEQVAILCTGSMQERSDAAASIVSLARDNSRYGKLIIEEGGLPPLLKLAREGKTEGQENAVRAIGLLGQDRESVQQIVNAGVCSVFAKILKEGQMKVQVIVAGAISEMAATHPECQDHFAQNNVIRLLVSHLAFETIQEHSNYAIPNKQKMPVHSVVIASNNHHGNDQAGKEEADKNSSEQIKQPTAIETLSQMHNMLNNATAMKNPTSSSHSSAKPPKLPSHSANHHGHHPRNNQNNTKPQHGHQSQHVGSGSKSRSREFEDPATKAQMKAMAAKALWQLSKGNVGICQTIAESRALLCFAILLEKGPEDVQSYSAMALMEITAVAERNAELRRSGFKPTSPAAKAVVDQLLKVIEKADSDLLVPCIRAIGSLARTFRATETRIIGPLVELLDEREAEVSMEAAIALNKFACRDNFLHVNHCKAMINVGGVKYLVQLVYFGEETIQITATILLCNISLHVPDSETLAREEVLIVLEWSTKQAHLINDSRIKTLLPEAKSRLELYQSRGSRGFH